MNALPQPARMSAEEFLVWERAQAERHEFYQGEVFCRAGGTRNHSLIATNFICTLGSLLRGQPCQALGCNLRILIEATGYQAYPDVSVICPPIEGPADDLVSNPVLVAEVLSPSTADFDRSVKFDHYRQIPTLQEYIVLWQDTARVEQRTRCESGDWLLKDTTGLGESVQLHCLDQPISLRDIYDKVVFADDAA